MERFTSVLAEAAPAVMVCMGMTVFLLMYLPSFARQVGLTASPDARKRHLDQIPLIGGIAIIVAFFFAVSLFPFGLSRFRIFLLCLGCLMIVGLLDDHHDIPAAGRLILQVLISSILVIGDDVVVSSIGDIFGWFDGNEQGLGWLAVPLTIISITGIINAYNMIDGHDGVAVSVFLLSASVALVFLVVGGDYALATLLLIFSSGVFIFLFFNMGGKSVRGKKSFLGDAGSTCLGFFIVYVLIVSTQKEVTPIMRTVTAPWLIGLPLLDMMAVIFFRAREGLSLVRPDRAHFHHILVDRGINRLRVLGVLTGIHLICCTGAVLGNVFLFIPDWLFFWSMFFVLGSFIAVTSGLRRGTDTAIR